MPPEVLPTLIGLDELVNVGLLGDAGTTTPLGIVKAGSGGGAGGAGGVKGPDAPTPAGELDTPTEIPSARDRDGTRPSPKAAITTAAIALTSRLIIVLSFRFYADSTPSIATGTSGNLPLYCTNGDAEAQNKGGKDILPSSLDSCPCMA